MFYWRFLFYLFDIDEKDFWKDNVYSNIKDNIDSFLLENVKKNQYTNKIVNELNYFARENILPLSDFKWIFDSEEITGLVWGYLVLERDIWNDTVIERYRKNNGKIDVRNSYESLNLPLIDNGHNGRIENIISYFDRQFLECHVVNSIDILNELRVIWFESNKIVKNSNGLMLRMEIVLDGYMIILKNIMIRRFLTIIKINTLVLHHYLYLNLFPTMKWKLKYITY